MAIRKRMTNGGLVYDARWRDGDGGHRQKTFSRLGDAKQHLAKIATKQVGGSRQSIAWLADAFLAEQRCRVDLATLERITYDGYESHIRLYLATDEIAKTKCGDLDAPAVRAFLLRLQAKTSPEYARKIRVTVSTMLQWGVDNGHLVHNPARGVRMKARARDAVSDDDFDDLEIELKIPTPDQVRAILAAADAWKPRDKGRAGAQFRLLFYGGLRPSEMLGVPVRLIALTASRRLAIKVAQRVGKRGEIGRLKTKKSRRKITLAVAPSLWIQEYLLSGGLAKDSLLFPTASGKPQLYSNFRERVWSPILGAAGFAEQVSTQRKYWAPKNKSERRAGAGAVARVEVRRHLRWRPQFTPHHGRHFAASALIAAGCPPKRLQAFMGHERLELTMNVYGHLFPDQRADEDLADAIDGQIRRA